MKKLLMLLLMSTPAYAASPNMDVPACVSEEKVRKDVTTWKYVTTIVRMDELETRNFLITYNAELPVSHYTADTSLALMPINIPVVVWVPFRNDCAVITLTFSRVYFMDLLKKGNT